MNEFGKTLMKIAGFIFGALLLGFTAFETFHFLTDVTGSPIVAAIGLVMFEGGFLYWAAEFKRGARGLAQMAISLLTSIADFTAVVVAVGLRLGAVDAGILGATTGAKLVVVAVLVNLTAKYAFSLADPETAKNIMKRASEGVATMRTFKAFQAKVQDAADHMADEMAEQWMSEFRADFNQAHKPMRDGDTNNWITDLLPTLSTGRIQEDDNGLVPLTQPKTNGVSAHKIGEETNALDFQ